MNENTEKNNISTNAIQIIADSYNSIENALMMRLYSEHYKFPIEGMTTTTELYPQLLAELENDYIFKNYNFSNTASNQMFIIEEENKSFIILIRSGIKDILSADIYAKDISEGEKLFKLFKKYEDSSTTTLIKIVSFSLSMNGQLEKSVITKSQEDFKTLSKLYYPFLDTDEMFTQYLISNDSLLLLAGESGTGKTKIVDMILDFSIKNTNLINFDEEDEEEAIYVAYVKNPQILATDAFWNQLAKTPFTFIILDDMDHILIDRNVDTESVSDETRRRFISNFLSYTDGIFSNDTKFIITTNQSVNNIDSAILRKGRCFDVLSFRALKHSEALDIWVEAGLNINDFEESFNDKIEINAADLGAKIEMISNLNERNMTAKSSYIKEDGISLYKKSFAKKISI